VSAPFDLCQRDPAAAVAALAEVARERAATPVWEACTVLRRERVLPVASSQVLVAESHERSRTRLRSGGEGRWLTEHWEGSPSEAKAPPAHAVSAPAPPRGAPEGSPAPAEALAPGSQAQLYCERSATAPPQRLARHWFELLRRLAPDELEAYGTLELCHEIILVANHRGLQTWHQGTRASWRVEVLDPRSRPGRAYALSHSLDGLDPAALAEEASARALLGRRWERPRVRSGPALLEAEAVAALLAALGRERPDLLAAAHDSGPRPLRSPLPPDLPLRPLHCDGRPWAPLPAPACLDPWDPLQLSLEPGPRPLESLLDAARGGFWISRVGGVLVPPQGEDTIIAYTRSGTFGIEHAGLGGRLEELELHLPLAALLHAPLALRSSERRAVLLPDTGDLILCPALLVPRLDLGA